MSSRLQGHSKQASNFSFKTVWKSLGVLLKPYRRTKGQKWRGTCQKEFFFHLKRLFFCRLSLFILGRCCTLRHQPRRALAQDFMICTPIILDNFRFKSIAWNFTTEVSFTSLTWLGVILKFGKMSWYIIELLYFCDLLLQNTRISQFSRYFDLICFLKYHLVKQVSSEKLTLRKWKMKAWEILSGAN